MTDSERQHERLREALTEEHQATGRRTPGFATVWSRAVAEMRPPREIRRRRFALATGAAAALVLILAVTIAPRTTGRPDPDELELAVTAAAAAADWQAPLDFLLDTPGREWLAAPPAWTLEPPSQPWGLTPDVLEPDTYRR